MKWWVLAPVLCACGAAATPQAETTPTSTSAPSATPDVAAAPCEHDARPLTCVESDGSPASMLEHARCLRDGGHLVDALRDAQKSLELAIQQGDAKVMKDARAEVRSDLEKIPHVTFFAQNPEAWRVEFDGRPVELDSMKKYSVDPGYHSISVRHRATNAAASQSVCLAPGELEAIPITN